MSKREAKIIWLLPFGRPKNPAIDNDKDGESDGHNYANLGSNMGYAVHEEAVKKSFKTLF